MQTRVTEMLACGCARTRVSRNTRVSYDRSLGFQGAGFWLSFFRGFGVLWLLFFETRTMSASQEQTLRRLQTVLLVKHSWWPATFCSRCTSRRPNAGIRDQVCVGPTKFGKRSTFHVRCNRTSSTLKLNSEPSNTTRKTLNPRNSKPLNHQTVHLKHLSFEPNFWTCTHRSLWFCVASSGPFLSRWAKLAMPDHPVKKRYLRGGVPTVGAK